MLSQIKPKSVKEVPEDESQVEAMKEELDQFQKNGIWTFIEPTF